MVGFFSAALGMSRLAEYIRTPGEESPYFSVLPNTRAPEKEQFQVSRLFIDNRDRYDAPNTSPFNFKVMFGNDPRSVGIAGYENVTSVELKAIAFPKIANEPYVIVSIDELNNNQLDATCTAAQNAFAIVYFDTDALPTGTTKPLKGSDFYLKQLAFNPPLARLHSLSVSFYKHDGNVVTLAETSNQGRVSLILEITSKVGRSY